MMDYSAKSQRTALYLISQYIELSSRRTQYRWVKETLSPVMKCDCSVTVKYSFILILLDSSLPILFFLSVFLALLVSSFVPLFLFLFASVFSVSHFFSRLLFFVHSIRTFSTLLFHYFPFSQR